MDIIFQSGDFFNETSAILSNLISIISALIGALISGLIAIYIFKKGIEKEKLKKKGEYISEFNDLEQYFFHNIDSINFFINKQIEEVSRCSQVTKDWNKKNFSLSIFPELSTSDIWKINQEKIYKIFVTNRAGEVKDKANDFINLRNSLHNLDDFIQRQTQLNKENFQRLFLNIELWNQSLKELVGLSNSFVIDYNSKPVKESDEFLKFFNELMVKRQRELLEENKSENMKIVFSELIEPIKRYLKENKQSSDIRILMISEPMMNIQKAYFEIKTLRHERRKEILNSGRRLLKIKELMNESVLNTKNREKIY